MLHKNNWFCKNRINWGAGSDLMTSKWVQSFCLGCLFDSLAVLICQPNSNPFLNKRKLITRSCSHISATRWLRQRGTEGAHSNFLLVPPFHLSSSLSFLQLWCCQLPLRYPQLPLGIFASHPRMSCYPYGEAGPFKVLLHCLRRGHRKCKMVMSKQADIAIFVSKKILHYDSIWEIKKK